MRLALFLILIALPASAQDASAKDASAQDLDRRVFSEPGFGYTLLIPEGWRDTVSEDYTAVFEPDAKDVSVAIQNRLAPLPGRPDDSIAALLRDYTEDLNQQSLNKKIHRNAAFIYDGPDGRLNGHQVVADFDLYEPDGTRVALRQWAVMIPRPEGEVVHVWMYTAPAGTFEEFREQAQVILDSWVIRRGL